MNSRVRIENIVKIITYLIGTISFMAVYKYIGIVYALSFLALFSFSVYFEQKRNFLIPRWLLNAISSIVIIISFFRLNLDDPVTPALEALIMLLAIKFLEKKQFRDYMQIYVISVFLLSGYALMSIDIIFLLYFISLIFMISVVIVLLTYFSHDPDMELEKDVVMKIVYKSVLIPLLSIPMTLFMFIILPRTNYPFFDFLNRGEKAKTGFTDNVRLGSVSDLQEDASTIFRANMEKIDDNLLYWRGIVLDYFDGATWRNNEISARASFGSIDKMFPYTDKRIRQTIYLEPYENRYLFGLDKPTAILLKNVRTYADITTSLSQIVDRRMKYEVISVLSDTIREQEIDPAVYLQLPPNLPEEIKALAHRLSSNDRRATVIAVLNFLRNGDYKYSMKNMPVSAAPMTDFLFKYKYGNCEYFASSMAVMLRVAGIPARLVGGYRGGYYNNTGKYYLVLQKNAHVWVEAYLENEGWLRLDPTPGSLEEFTSLGKRSFMFRVRLFLDAIDYFWNASIISYNLEKQFSLLHNLRTGLKKPEIRFSSIKKELGVYLSGALFVALTAFLIYRFVLFRKTEEEKIMELFAWKMKKYGYERKRSEGLEEFVSSIADARLREKAHIFAIEFEMHFYKDRKLTGEESARLRQIIKDI